MVKPISKPRVPFPIAMVKLKYIAFTKHLNGSNEMATQSEMEKLKYIAFTKHLNGGNEMVS